MTIKQQGGIFGRNPTFNDLTSNTGQFDGLITANGEVVIQGNNNAADNNTLQIKNTDTAVGSGDNIGKIEFYNSDVSDAGVAVTVKAEAASGTGLTDLVFITGKPSDSTESMRVTYNHHLDMTTGGGYVKLGNGAGIDFSATSGTGTSELFDDYEEGTWTPVIADASSGGNTASITVVGAKYIKIGKIVHLYARINNINTSGMTSGNAVSIQGLPFTSGVDVFSCGSCVLDRIGAGGDTTINPKIDESSSFMQLAVTSSANGTSDANLLVSQIGSTGSDIHSLQITYEAS